MPHFTNSIPRDPRGHSLPVTRTPTSRPISAIVTSSDLCGCDTHYYKGRTMPCERPDCEPCSHGIPFRWHAYVSAYNPATHTHFLFECTAQAAEAFVAYREAHGTLRGCLFTAYRLHRRPNGRVIIQTKPADLEKTTLPKEPCIPDVLAIVWNLPADEIDTPSRAKNMPHVRTNSKPSGHKDSAHHLKEVLAYYEPKAPPPPNPIP